jgi:predicted MarR family transcription regulator
MLLGMTTEGDPSRESGDPASPDGDVDRRWHLAQAPLEVRLTELEYALMRTFESFLRWQTECLALSAGIQASGPENALLHVVRMKDRPKSVKELARLTNREDIPNIQYGLRKLMKAGLVEREGASRTGVVYSVTEQGREVTDRYARARRELLVALAARLDDPEKGFGDAAQVLDLLSGLYDRAALAATTHRRE